MTNRLFPNQIDPLPKGRPVEEIEVEKLLLDADNPRLDISGSTTQERIAAQLYANHRLEELMSSFLANGYFHEEPLVAVPSLKKGLYVVVEGNRRLAALKLLLEPGLAKRVKATTVPDSSAPQLDRIRKVPVKVYDTRSEVLPYLGFRHITGVKEWDAASKARYVYQLKETTSHSLVEIGDMIGDTYNMTERLYLGWSLVKQAEEKLGVGQDDFVKFPFSYMYDAVRTPEVKVFLGLKPDSYHVPKAHHEELRELLSWLFGSKSLRQQPLVERKDQLKMLAGVVSDKKATTAIRSGASLEEAFHETVGEENMLIEWLTRASRELDRAKGIIHRHRKSPDVRDLVTRCFETTQRLDREMK
jgi:hypothetical protein